MTDWPGLEIERLEAGDLSLGVAPGLGGGVLWLRSGAEEDGAPAADCFYCRPPYP